MFELWKSLFSPAREFLAGLPFVGALGPYAALTLAVWATLWAVRRYRPAWWARMLRTGLDPEGATSHFVQAVPGALLGALWAGGTTLELEQAAWGLLSGLGSALLHHALKAAPVAYQGALKVAALELWECVRCGCLWRPAEGPADAPGDSWKLHDANQVPCSKCDNSALFRDIIRKVGGISLALLACTGCTKADMLKVVNTADDAAKVACALFFSEHQGITPHEAAKLFCDTREAIDVFLASQKQAGEEMAAAQGISRK